MYCTVNVTVTLHRSLIIRRGGECYSSFISSSSISSTFFMNSLNLRIISRYSSSFSGVITHSFTILTLFSASFPHSLQTASLYLYPLHDFISIVFARTWKNVLTSVYLIIPSYGFKFTFFFSAHFLRWVLLVRFFFFFFAFRAFSVLDFPVVSIYLLLNVLRLFKSFVD